MKNVFPLLTLLLLVSCGGSDGQPETTIPPIPAEPTFPSTDPVVIPEPPPAAEPVVDVPPMPVEETPPAVVQPEPKPEPVPNEEPRTTVKPTPPHGMYTIYRVEATNSETPWYQLVGSFRTIEEAESRFKQEGAPLMWEPEYHFFIMTGEPNNFWGYNWQQLCIDC